MNSETIGAWIIHHGRKIARHAYGAAEYPALDEAAKAAVLLSRLAESDEAQLSLPEVHAIARAAGLNPRLELPPLLSRLESRRLLEQSSDSIRVLGLSGRAVLQHATALYRDAQPTPYEEASITLSEVSSISPVRRKEAAQLVGDRHAIPHTQLTDFLDAAEEIGFVDAAGKGDDRLLFNGNLFRRDSVEKSHRVLSSLTQEDQGRVREVSALFDEYGCMSAHKAVRILTPPLFKKLVAAGRYDISTVSNPSGSYHFATLPSAFHKFHSPLVDDCFDLAKSLVASLTYGMHFRTRYSGRIRVLPALLGRLIAGREVGPATAIGSDYRILEVQRVVALREDPENPGRFYMRLLKREVGELALQVLTEGSVDPSAPLNFSTASLTQYRGPEDSRTLVRKHQGSLSKRATMEVLDAIRSGDAYL